MATARKSKKPHSRQKTLRRVHRAARKLGGQCLTNAVRPLNEGWRFRCERGHHFSKPAKAVLDGRSWCEKCKKEDMVQRVHQAAEESDGQCLTKQWRPTAENWTFVCEHGHRIRRPAQQILQKGLYCRRCDDDRKLEQIHIRAEATGGRCLETSYKGARTRMQFQCVNGHKLSRIAKTVLENGLRCDECAAENTYKTISRAAEKKGWSCVQRTGASVNVRWAFECENGHRLYRKPQSVLASGGQCDICYREKAFAELLRIAKSRNGKVLSDALDTARSTVRLVCENGHRFSRNATDVIHRGYWCNRCTNRSTGAMLEKTRKVARGRGGTCLNNEYVPRPGKMVFECAEGHQWEAIANLVIYSEQWCPECAKQTDPQAIRRFETRVKEAGGRMLSKRLGHFSEQHRFQCKNGHKFWQIPARIAHRGSWCQKCAWTETADKKRLGIEAAREAAARHGGQCLTNDYQSAEDYAWWRCKKGHEWRTKFKAVIHGDRWCPECWNELKKQGLDRNGKPVLFNPQRKLSLEFCQDLAKNFGGKCISIEYENYLAKLEWVCAEGHEFEASLHNMEQRDAFCLECAESERRQELLIMCQDFAAQKGGHCLSDEWLTAQTKMKWRCRRGHEFEKAWNQAKLDPFCGQCAREEKYQEDGARRLNDIAQAHGGRWIASAYEGMRVQYEFECKSGHRFKATPHSAHNSWNKLCDCADAQ